MVCIQVREFSPDFSHDKTKKLSGNIESNIRNIF